jgi:hypothetical protein
MSVNPFEVLRLDPRASEEEIVAQAGHLRQRSADEASLDALRQAVQALTSDPASRHLQALLTPPRPGHAAPALDRFVAANRRPPASAAPSLPSFDEAEFLRLLLAHVAEALTGAAAAMFEPCGGDEEEHEIHRQAAEAMWSSLIHDSRA